MSYYFNELSVHGQFSSQAEFEIAIDDIMACRAKALADGHSFFSSPYLLGRPVVDGLLFKEAVASIPRRDVRQGIILWLDRGSWLPTQSHPDSEEWDCGGNCITSLAPAEVAYRSTLGEEVEVFSAFPSDFTYTPLGVTRLNEELEESQVDVGNCWDAISLGLSLSIRTARRRNAVINDWAGMLAWARDFCKGLYMSPEIDDLIRKYPFGLAAGTSIQRLLLILNEYQASLLPSGIPGPRGDEILELYFRSGNPLFSDESDSNKRTFKNELTFPNPLKRGETVFCPYHGKISTNVFRLHFTWPARYGEQIIVTYIGPKITKD